MTRLRPLIGLILALTLLLGSVVGAVARNEMLGATDLALCGETGLIQIDATGHPIASRHACPHCLAASGVAMLAAVPILTRPLTLPGITPRPDPTTPASTAQTLAPSARGPPALA